MITDCFLKGTFMADNYTGMREPQRKENKMGTKSIGSLVVTMSLPMMISMLVQALYNIVDSIFVSRIEEMALSAVSMAFPIQVFLIALSGGTAVGVNAVLSKALGAKEQRKANLAATNGIFIALVCYIFFLFFGLTLVKPFYAMQTDIEGLISYGTDYLSIITICSFGLFGQMIFERLLTSTGRTFLSMITQATGAIINIILDPIFIFGLGDIPAMGTAGAAIATVMGQTIAAILAYIFNKKFNRDIQISFKGFKADFAVIKEILIIGIPSIIMQAIGSIMNLVMNMVLLKFSPTAVAVFGTYYKMQSFIFMPIFGLNTGLVPIIAYNFGAKKKARMLSAWRLAWGIATVIMLCGTALFMIIPQVMLRLFDASNEMLEIGVKAFRIISVHFPVAAFCIVTGTLFQAVGKSLYSMLVSILRQLLALVPAALILGSLGNVDLVWWAFPIAEVISLCATVFFLKRTNRTVIDVICPD